MKDIENRKCNITGLATNSTLNAKINEVKSKIPNITILATNTALTAVENKTTNVSNLVKNCFSSEIILSYCVFIPDKKCIK